MATLRWLNSTSGDFSIGANWAAGVTPGAADWAQIDAAGSYSVAITTAQAVNALLLNAAGGTVVDSGSLTVGTALTVAAGTFDLAAGGVVSGGTLSATGGSFLWNGGTLSGATYQGVLDLTGVGESLSVANGLAMTGAGGTGAGTIDASGRAASLTFLGAQTIDNVTINAGSLAGVGGTSLNFGDLTLGAHATLNQVGGSSPAFSGGSTDTGISLTNNGTIEASATGGANIVTTTFVNNGLISTPAGGWFSITATNATNNGTISGDVPFNNLGTLTNNGVITATGGGGSAAGAIFVNNGVFNDAGGFGSTPGGWFNNGTFNLGSSTGQSYLALIGGTATPVAGLSLGTINLVGVGTQLRLLGSQSWQAGTINVGGTSQQITESPLTPVAGATSQLVLGAQTVMNHTAGSSTFNTGQLTLDGTINASAAGGLFTIASGTLIDNGAINVSNGDHLLLNSTMSGTGSITIASGGIAEIGSLTASTDPVVFTDTAKSTLRLGMYYRYSGPIQGFTDGNTIDLSGVTATSATWANGVLTVGQGGATPLTLAMPGNYAGATFHIAPDGILSSSPYFALAIYQGSNITVTGAPAPGQPSRVYGGTGATLSAVEGSAVSGAVASFTDSNATDTASQFAATINWGDGSTSAGVVSGSAGAFTVSAAAGHAYADEGTFATSVTFTNSADNVATTLGGTTAVAEADVLTAQTAPGISVTAGQAFNGTVATFTDSYTANTASDLTATIVWGDGSTSAGTVTDVNGAISVAGSHAYAAVGSNAVSVTLKDADGTATASTSGSATVTTPYAGTGQTVATLEGTAVTGAVATFTDANTADAAGSFTATIAWGDGTTSAGTVSGSNGVFSVAGATGHSYAAEGAHTITTTVTHTADAASFAVTGSVTVAEADVFTAGAATAISATAGTAFSGTVATFTDSYTANTASDLTAAIVWGDGTTSAGTVTDVNGAISVSGTHSYANAGTDAVSVTLSDSDGTATAVAGGAATVAAAVATPPGSYTLTTKQDHLVGGSGNDLFVARTGTLTSGDVIDGAGGTNTLQLLGGGVFKLSNPDTLANIQVVQAQEGAGVTAQVVTLRENTAMTVNVGSGPAGTGILINGAQNHDVINLGSGNDTIVMGVGETANGGGGNAIYKVNQDSIFDTINGGSAGTNTLVVTAGGNQVMGSNITGMTAVDLTVKTIFTANSTANMTIAGSTVGGDTIILGAASQSVISGGPAEKIQASAANAGALVSCVGAGSTLEITSGGTIALNAATSVATVKLDAASNLTLSNMSFIAAAGSSGADTIIAAATYQTLTGGAGADTLVGFAGGFTTFADKASGLNGDFIANFVSTDLIDINNLAFAGASLKAVASGANTLVTLMSGGSKAAFTLGGSFATSGFHLASDGSLGTIITHS